MYNRYAPKENGQPIQLEQEQRSAGNGTNSGRSGGGSPFSFLNQLLGGAKNAGGAGILEHLGLQKLDSGDLLLLLILFFLFRESEDEEWLIILALVLLMGLED